MVKFKVETNYNGINGLCIIEPVVFKDKRGYLFEAFNEKELSFLNANFVQDNQAYSIDGVLRGFGINKKVPQAKLVRVLRGCIFDVVIDLRKNSRTFMKWSVVEISKDNQKQQVQ